MNILITGHLGYIGSAMIRIVREAGHRAAGLDVGYYRECVINNGSGADPDHEIALDIRDVHSEHLRGADAIVHLAGLSNESLARRNPNLIHQVNYEGTMRLARLAKHIGITRFVFASSCSVYGAASGSERPLTENDPIMPITDVSAVKAMTERGLSALADESFTPVYLRYATVFGVSPRMRFDTVVNNLVAWAVSTGKVQVESDGTSWRPVVHVEDVVRATIAAVEAPTKLVHDQAYNIGRKNANYQVTEIARTVARGVIGSKIVITGKKPEFPQSYQVDFTRATDRLPGFAPRWTLEAGCREMIRWYRDRHRQAPPFDSRHFVRAKQVEHLLGIGVLDEQLRFVDR